MYNSIILENQTLLININLHAEKCVGIVQTMSRSFDKFFQFDRNNQQKLNGDERILKINNDLPFLFQVPLQELMSLI